MVSVSFVATEIRLADGDAHSMLTKTECCRKQPRQKTGAARCTSGKVRDPHTTILSRLTTVWNKCRELSERHVKQATQYAQYGKGAGMVLNTINSRCAARPDTYRPGQRSETGNGCTPASDR